MFGDLGADLGASVVSDSCQCNQGHMAGVLLFKQWEELLQKTWTRSEISFSPITGEDRINAVAPFSRSLSLRMESADILAKIPTMPPVIFSDWRFAS